MKIEVNKLKRLIKKASLNGNISTINLDFKEAGVSSAVKNYPQTALTVTELKASAFEAYEPIGEIFIKNSLNFLKYLGTFDGIISFDKTSDYMIKLDSEGRTGFIILGSEKACENVYRNDLPSLESTTTIPLTKADVKRSLEDTSLLNIKQVEVKKENDTVSFEVGEKKTYDYFVNSIKTEVPGKGHVKLGESFAHLFNSLDGDFTISIGKDIPAVFKEVSDEITFTCILAPIVSGE